MALGFSTTLRNARATAIRDALDAGSGPGVIEFYDGARPATGGTATTLLATCTLADPSGTISNGVFTLGAVVDGTGTAGATAGGKTATWARLKDSDGTFVMDASVSATGGGGDIQLNSTTIATGQTVKVTSGTITEGNA